MYNKMLLCYAIIVNFLCQKITLQVTAVHLSDINQNEDAIPSFDKQGVLNAVWLG